jgi:hypothetical protein
MEALVGGEAACAQALLQRLRRATLGWRPLIIEHSPTWACRCSGRSTKRIDMLLVDHGVFRLLYLNKHRLGARAWRSAQPAPHQIRPMARRGLRTIINLRGRVPAAAIGQSGIRAGARRHARHFQVRSREAPRGATIKAARDLFERIEYPV